MDNVVNQYYLDCCELLESAKRNGAMSTVVVSEAIVQKHFAICVASHFEKILCNAVETYYQNASGIHTPAVSFVRNRAIERQYHTWFDWNETNANRFFSFFGKEFKKYMIDKMEEEDRLNASVKDFLELGRERNKLVHGDLSTVSFDKTMDEIFLKYKSACLFVDLFPDVLYEFATKDLEE